MPGTDCPSVNQAGGFIPGGDEACGRVACARTVPPAGVQDGEWPAAPKAIDREMDQTQGIPVTIDLDLGRIKPLANKISTKA